MEEIKIVINERLHPSLNDWTNWHWTERKEIKEIWEAEIGYLVGRYGSPKLTNVIIDITYYFPDKRVRDKDNYTPKFIMDSLVKAELLKDDNDNDIYLNWKLKYDKENPRTEIRIKEY